jgi:predicted HicB family RNase H-like nuclease
MPSTVATNIRLPAELLKAFKHRAVEERKSVNQMIREAIEMSLNSAQKSFRL